MEESQPPKTNIGYIEVLPSPPYNLSPSVTASTDTMTSEDYSYVGEDDDTHTLYTGVRICRLTILFYTYVLHCGHSCI